MFLWHCVWGWPFRLAASRVRATRCHGQALGGAASGLSLVASGRYFLPKAVVRMVYSCMWCPDKVCADLLL